jgi:hypothetical protein
MAMSLAWLAKLPTWRACRNAAAVRMGNARWRKTCRGSIRRRGRQGPGAGRVRCAPWRGRVCRGCQRMIRRSPATDAPRFLSEPAELANLQIRHGDDEHALCLANLRNPLSAEGTRRIGPRLRISFQSLIVRVASIIGNDPQCRISRD